MTEPGCATGALDVARSYLRALGNDDPDAVAAHVAEDFVNEHQSELGRGCTGRDAYRERLPDFMASFPHRTYTIVELIGASVTASAADTSDDTDIDDTDIGDTDVVAARYRFGADVEGHRVDIPGVMWFGIRDGFITRRVDTWDSLTFFRQTGQQPPDPPTGTR